MAPSNRFIELNARLVELRQNLLPDKFSATGDYTDREMDCARGYRLLAHAEVESYLEDVSRETVTNAIRDWKKSGITSKPLIAFLAAYHSSWCTGDQINNEQIIKIAKSRVNIKESVNKVIDLAQIQFLQRIKDNHGIKEINFYVLVLPTGIDPSELDETWIANLNNFGSLRGDVAHQSKKATSAINPKDEFELVGKILAGLEDLDKRLM
jgi:hypothetical protein